MRKKSTGQKRNAKKRKTKHLITDWENGKSVLTYSDVSAKYITLHIAYG